MGVKCYPFHENDLDDSLTAFATEPVVGDKRKLLRKLKLIQPKDLKPKLSDLHSEMERCPQTDTQSVREHGLSVEKHFQELIKEKDLNEWRLPKWWKYSKNIIDNIHTEQIISEYLIYHDCGKPKCLIEIDGKKHFPNHAEVSKEVFLEFGGNEVAAKLIGYDMEIHTASAERIQELCNVWSIKDASTLLLAALSELHSNSRMFGGIESVSFKSKFKQIERRGNQICKIFFE